jgi:predicted O-linked N-acetylglucosamine transferase (SPINDLY family)
MSDLVVESRRDYRAPALRLATEPETLQTVERRHATARENTPMFQTKSYVRNYERALDTIVQRWREAKPPANLHFLSYGNIRAE